MGLYLGSVHAHLSGHDNLGLIKKTDDKGSFLLFLALGYFCIINADAPYFFNLESFLPFFLPISKIQFLPN
jgi:hypothetical protein